MKTFFTLLLSVGVLFVQAQDTPGEQIMDVLQKQAQAWNAGDMEEYMQGYWQSDSLLFIGKGGLSYGWEQTLTNYKKKYPDARAMGRLSFSEIDIRPLQENRVYFVVGRWHLSREQEAGDLGGWFSLVWEKKDGRWVVVADHSS